MTRISQRACAMSPSATLAMAAKARRMRAEGVEVISFATGEPDFVTPPAIREEAKRALDEGLTHYTPSAGIPELKRAVVNKLARDNGLKYDDDEVTITCGAKQAIYNALQVIIDPGDEVIIPAPYWVSFPDQVRLADGKPVIITTTIDGSFKVTPKALEQAITSRTRAIILNTPSNPTGSAYTQEELERIGGLMCRHGITVISDEIYEKLTYDGFVHTSIAAAHPPAKEITIVVGGVSKAYAMTGWRMGFAAGPKEIITKMTMLVGQQITGIPAFVQRACVAAFDGAHEEVERMRREFESRRDLMLKRLLTVPGISCHKPEGAFYLFPNVGSYLGRKWKGHTMDSATALANFLLEEGHIAVVSGDPFGAPGHIRLSYAASREDIEEGIRRLKEALAKLK
jgi:aspartate aminotransferase